MTVLAPAPVSLDPASVALLMGDLGFLAGSDLPDRPGPAYLLISMRAVPTLRHFDPEAVEYWVNRDGRGTRATLTRSTPLPLDTEFSWGLIRIIDRLRVTNEYLTFGGRLSAAMVDDVLVAAFTSPAPLLRRGGHSQGWDPGAESLGAFFSRLLLAVDYAPGFEARAAKAEPITRYAAFVSDATARFRSSPVLRDEHAGLWAILQAEERRLRANCPTSWDRGEGLRQAAGL